MKKFGVVDVRPRNKGKGVPLLCNKTKNNQNLGCPTKENRKQDYLWDVLQSSRDIGSWEEMCSEGK